MGTPRLPLGLAAAVALAGCGGDEARDPRYDVTKPAPQIGAQPLRERSVPERAPGARRPRRSHPSAADAERLRPVLAAWAKALRRSDPAAAAGFFELPAIVSQGQPIELQTREQVRAWNASLPCGAVLMYVQQDGRFVVGTFRLTDRPGSRCDAPDALVRVAFVFHGRRFSEWYQVPDARGAPPGPENRPVAPPPGRQTI